MKKLKSLKFLINFSKNCKKNKNKIVLCHGGFDFLHLGHLKHFKAAKKYGDYLVVSITSANLLRKGLNRPIYSDNERVEFLSSIDIIDYIYIDNNLSASNIISEIKPNFYAKGSDYKDLKKDFSKKILQEVKLTKKYGGKVIFTNEKVFSSSSLINNNLLSKELINKIHLIKKKFSYNKIFQTLSQMRNKKVLIIGDTIIDEYIYVSQLGKPSKENIIASQYLKKETFLGGVFASVANLSSFCNKIDVLTTVSKDEEINDFIKANIPKNINKKIFYLKNSPITKKTRFIDNSHTNLKKLYEIYKMDDSPIDNKLEGKIFTFLNKNIKKYDLIIINDYGHGLITEKLVKLISNKSKFLTINAQINAGNRGYNLITKYKKGNYYCLDLNEGRMATGDKYIEVKDIPKEVLKLTKGKNISLTMGGNGSISSSGKNLIYTPSFTNTVVDTMSAGDAYFVISSMMFYLSKSLEVSSLLGNLAGAITAGTKGCVPINKDKFLETLNSYLKT